MVRIAIPLLFLCLLRTAAFSQNVFTNGDTVVFDMFLLLDSNWTNGPADRFVMDDASSYFQVKDNKAELRGQSRGRTFFYEGAVKGIEERFDPDGNEQVYFYLVPEGDKARSIIVQLTRLPSGKTHIHAYNPLGSFDRFFLAHTKTEL